jgi:hypothetical protein
MHIAQQRKIQNVNNLTNSVPAGCSASWRWHRRRKISGNVVKLGRNGSLLEQLPKQIPLGISCLFLSRHIAVLTFADEVRFSKVQAADV